MYYNMTFNEELHLENKSVEERNNYYTQMIRNIEKYYQEHLLSCSSDEEIKVVTEHWEDELSILRDKLVL